jgi:DNA mismatch repair protein MutL
VVKELIENALDAGATEIIIQIKDGGKELIRITDNGYGMAPEDARLSIEQYATSKISSVHDLATLETFGFRGEALASICAVSNVLLRTKQADDQQGIELTIAHGTIIKEQPSAGTVGTDITITDLFYNVPARRKFLKKRETELHQIQLLFQAFCFVYKQVTFKLFHDGKLIYNCPGVTTLTTRFAQLWDHAYATNMLPIAAHDRGITLSGAISDAHIARYDRAHIFVFVNNRWVKNSSLVKAIIKGYMNVLPPARFPAVGLAITIDPRLVDINIHPRKEEVQFINPRIVELMISEAIKKRLDEQLSKNITGSTTAQSHLQDIPGAATHSPLPSATLWQPSWQTTPLQPLPSAEILLGNLQGAHEDRQPLVVRPQHITAPDNYMVTEQPTALALGNLIGQFKKTYLLLEHENGLFCIDQHAAHERILYEKFAHRFDEIVTVQLLFAHTITLTVTDLETLLPHLDLFAMHGIGLEPSGNNQLVVQSLPVYIKNQPIDDLIQQVIGWLHEYTTLDTDELHTKIHEKMRAQMACKAAIKAGDLLNFEQMQQLLADLVTTPNRFTCPHGRPTGWLLPLQELEKKFKRNYK